MQLVANVVVHSVAIMQHLDGLHHRDGRVSSAPSPINNHHHFSQIQQRSHLQMGSEGAPDTSSFTYRIQDGSRRRDELDWR